jgi:hypothetical protein
MAAPLAGTLNDLPAKPLMTPVRRSALRLLP